jgi:uncharacterized BrkB/YihY/UPF0761 family membrane protein
MTSVEAQRLTLLFLIAVTVLVIGYDVLIVRAAGPDASISRVLCKLFGRWPAAAIAVVFWLGILTGHVWLPNE